MERSLRRTILLLLCAWVLPACGGGGGGGGAPAPTPAGPGDLDAAFGSDGVVLEDVSATEEDAATALAADSGDLFVAGYDSAPAAAGDTQWRIEKRNGATGALVAGFGAGGVFQVNPGVGAGLDDRPTAVALTVTHVIVAGWNSITVANRQWMVVKLDRTTGVPDPGFGTAGTWTADPSATLDQPAALATVGTLLYLAGFNETLGAANRQWQITCLDATTGIPVAPFGTGGTVLSNPSTTGDEATCLLRAGPDLYIGGFDSFTVNARLRLEKRNPGSGALEATFGTGGVIVSDTSAGDDRALALANSGASVFMVGRDGTSGGRWRIEAYSESDGAPTLTFGTAGVRLSDPSASDDVPSCVHVDGGTIYAGGWDRVPGATDSRWRIEAFLETDGSDATSFAGGAVATDPSTGLDLLAGLAGDATGLWAAGLDLSTGTGAWRIERRLK